MSDLDIWEEDGDQRIGCTWCGGEACEGCEQTRRSMFRSLPVRGMHSALFENGSTPGSDRAIAEPSPDGHNPRESGSTPPPGEQT